MKIKSAGVVTLATFSALLFAVACDQSPTQPSVGASTSDLAPVYAGQGIPSQVTVEFGRDNVGSPFPPPDGHDASGHARDKMFPRTVVLASGGSVTFKMGTVHQVAVYSPGTEPSDIVISPATLEDVTMEFGVFIPNFRINDPTNRIALGSPQSLFPSEWTTPPGTFDQPGLYLVICTTVPHFAAANMYAWVRVK